MRLRKIVGFLLLFGIGFFACTSDNKPDTTDQPAVKIEVPKFNAQNAYDNVAKQVEFGPRVPNTEAHQKAAAWLAAQLKEHGAQVTVQEAQVKAYNGKTLNAKNVIGVYNPTAKRRVLLAAHWDSRHIADAETGEEAKNPILGADDGASGVGVLLEIARILKEQDFKDMGVDIIFFDAEDYGQPSDGGGFPEMRDSWCLGSQYWARNPHKTGYRADFGILLDMVGSKGATFAMDGISMRFAGDYMKKIWNLAHKKGYGQYFDYTRTDELTDDHLYVNIIAKVPMLDIINRSPTKPSKFGDHWHTHNDNMDVISKNTLKATGQTVLNTLYYYRAGQL